MGRTLLTVGLLLLAGPGAAQGVRSAPFCLVSNTGQASCYYYTLDSCRSAQASLGGMCAAAAPETPPPPRPASRWQMPAQALPDTASSMQRAYDLGRRQSAPPPARSAQPSSGYRVNYACRAADGTTYTSQIPILGCMVVSIEFGP